MARVWTAYGIFATLLVVFFVARLAASPGYRRRLSSGGRDWRIDLGVMAALATYGLCSGLLWQGSPWTLYALLPVLLAFAALRRRRLRAVPSQELSPAMRRLLAAPGPFELYRHPLRSLKRNTSTIRQVWSTPGRAAEREWDIARGLRPPPESGSEAR